MFSNLRSTWYKPLRYCFGGDGNWSGHLPFAADLIEAAKPSSVVELGTQYGESYFGFCQTVQECGLSCLTYAVDTWDGDEFESISAYNLAHYRSFSTLLRLSFDEAATRFAVGTIDLLHLDGRHAYAAVKHDFETWLPKVSPNGIILMRDIAVRQGDVGACRFWEEISAQFPSFAFHHSRGLGVISKASAGQLQNPFFAALFAGKCNPQAIRDYYVLCAERLYAHRAAAQRLEQMESELARLHSEREADARLQQQAEAELGRIRGECAAQAGRVEQLEADVTLLRATGHVCTQLRQQAQAEVLRLRDELAAFSERLGKAEAEAFAITDHRRRIESGLDRLRAEARQSQMEMEALRTSHDAAQSQRAAMKQSLSWRITAPLRRLGSLLAFHRQVE